MWGDVAVEGGLQPLLKLREEGARAAGQEERERGEPSSHPVHSAQTREERLKHHHICVREREREREMQSFLVSRVSIVQLTAACRGTYGPATYH